MEGLSFRKNSQQCQRPDHADPRTQPVTTQFVRVLMTESSNTCDEHGSARRAQLRRLRDAGIAGRHLGCGRRASPTHLRKPPGTRPPSIGFFVDRPLARRIRRATTRGNYQHTGFDLFFTSGITNNLPAMIPVTMLYGTPEDSAAQIALHREARLYRSATSRWARNLTASYAMPEDYGALYIQWADALHKVDPALKLGGPVFEGVNEDIHVWRDAQGQHVVDGALRCLPEVPRPSRRPGVRFASSTIPLERHCKIAWKDLCTLSRS